MAKLKLKWYMKVIDSKKDSITIKISPMWVFVRKKLQPILCFLGFHLFVYDKYSICLNCCKQYDETFFYKLKKFINKLRK